MVAEAMTELGLNPADIETVQVVTDEDAVRERFTGSPTVRVDGTDIEPPEADTPAALTCRVYFRQDGRPSPLPDPARVRHALERALDRTHPA